jgi:hypothetical protein
MKTVCGTSVVPASHLPTPIQGTLPPLERVGVDAPSESSITLAERARILIEAVELWAHNFSLTKEFRADIAAKNGSLNLDTDASIPLGVFTDRRISLWDDLETSALEERKLYVYLSPIAGVYVKRECSRSVFHDDPRYDEDRHTVRAPSQPITLSDAVKLVRAGLTLETLSTFLRSYAAL